MRDHAFEELWAQGPQDTTARFDPTQITVDLHLADHAAHLDLETEGEFFRVTVDHAEFR